MSWVHVSEASGESVERRRVHGGWVYRFAEWVPPGMLGAKVNMVFVPYDPERESHMLLAEATRK
jgi:hypothetical protein